MVDLLKKIGLSELEARCYITFHEEPDLSGYEVAKRVSVSRTNVYSASRLPGTCARKYFEHFHRAVG
ncbi:hypothetical protein AMI01nite_19150 [Aneurinibacillus migulanus]|nr:hypothetical protein AMI01nite_19150 [Aneurinibacillus migulanus]